MGAQLEGEEWAADVMSDNDWQRSTLVHSKGENMSRCETSFLRSLLNDTI